MTLHVTKPMLAASYALLQTSKPFSGWRLPPQDEVRFTVSESKDRRGEYVCDGADHHIYISAKLVGSFHELLTTMAHEMCHLRQEIAHPNDKAHHGARFHKYADQVCKAHGFDRKAF